MKFTEMELKVLDAITKDDFYEDGVNSTIWADVFLDTVKGYYNIDSKTVRGVLASLIKKKIIKPIMKGRDGSISFTEYGKSIMEDFLNKGLIG